MASSSAVTLTNTGFIYEGCEHAYNQVISLYFYYLVTKVTVLFFHAGNRHSADLDIYSEGYAKPIKIRPSFKMSFTLNPLASEYAASERAAKSVIELYEQLAKRTFLFRVQRYSSMIEKHGYFLYDNKKFFADGRVSDGKREINLKTERPIHRRPFEVYYETPKTTKDHLLNTLVWRQDFVISTKYDADAFFFLLERLFGLCWK